MTTPSYPPYHTTLPHLTKDNWREHAAQKRADLAESIPKDWRLPAGKYDHLDNVIDVPRECGILTPKELEITEIDDAAVLLERLASKRYSAVEVTTAFCKRAAIAHQLVNCLTETLFERALSRARELDQQLSGTGRLSGPLHGLPISLKDQFDIKGVPLTMGYAAYLGRISPESSSLVTLLESAGAIIGVRTNVPQTLMLGDTVNHVYGRTVNPYNRKLSPGGSSGGEGALIAMKGSILGVGTDIGGSVRIPSAFCGLTTIRPTTRRIPYGKATNSLLGQESIMSVAGPMARSLSTIRTFFQTVVDANASNFDSGALPFAFNSQLYKQIQSLDKLCFGVAWDDGTVHPAPPLTRGMRAAIAALKKAGHEVVEFDMGQFKRTTTLAVEMYDADGGTDIRKVLEPIDEPLIDHVVVGKNGAKTVFETYQLNREKEALQQAFLEYWLSFQSKTSTGRPIDGLLTFAAPIPACIPGDHKTIGYTAIFNLLDLPATVFPVTKVDAAVDAWGSDRPQPYGDMDKGTMDRFDPAGCDGVPVTLQLVGRRWQEEALLALTGRVMDVLDGNSTKTKL